MKIRIRELFNKVLFFNKPQEDIVKLKIIEEAKYLSIPVNTDVFVNDAFNFTAPKISSIAPPSGVVAGGTTITIAGTNLSGTSSVTVGGNPASITSVSDGSVTAVTPQGTAGPQTITLTTPGGTATSTLLILAYPQ